jgi:hypothetical protein
MVDHILPCRKKLVNPTCGLAGLVKYCYDGRHGETVTRFQRLLDSERDLGINPAFDHGKVLFVEIHSLDNERGCYASNRYFSEFFGISERQIQTYIANLKMNGFISVTIQNRYERVMRAAGKYARVHGEELRQLRRDKARLTACPPIKI